MKMIESHGKTVDEAVATGLVQLGLIKDEVDVMVLDQGSKGFLGIGAKPARVLLTEKIKLREPQEPVARQKLPREPKSQPVRETAQAAEAKPAAEKKEERAPREENRPARESRPAKRPDASKPVSEAETAQPERKPQEPRQKGQGESRRSQQNGEGKKPQNGAEAAQRPPRAQGQRPPKTPAQRSEHEEAENPGNLPPASEEVVQMTQEAKAYLESIISHMGFTAQVEAHASGKDVFIDIQGAEAGALIGYRGETLDALQYLVSLRINKGEEAYHRVTLNAENYRAKREETLRKLAVRLAAKAVKSGRKVVLEPMNPYERRILHSTLQSNNAVKTHSEGDEPYRRVVITPRRAPRQRSEQE